MECRPCGRAIEVDEERVSGEVVCHIGELVLLMVGS